MRQISFIPAIQLQSRAARYQENLQPWAQRMHCTTIRSSTPQAPLAIGSAETDGGDMRQAARQRLEAVLFLAREPLNTRKLAQYANLADGSEARTLIRHLNDHYDQLGRAFRVEQVAGGFQLMTRRLFSSWLRRLGHVPPELRLSAPALETLAVIAYRQPTPRADIEAIRGVNCGEVIRQLMERDLVRIGSRSEELGRPFLYNTTKRFLQLFGLVNLEELPRAREMRAWAATAGLSENLANPNDKLGTPSNYLGTPSENSNLNLAATVDSFSPMADEP
jgi:segregation and condensation protein B